MISPAIPRLLDLADESHKATKMMIDGSFVRFSAATYRRLKARLGSFLGIENLTQLPKGQGVWPQSCKDEDVGWAKWWVKICEGCL
jgi:hypothetical protein